jgi:outer membrane protein assembly factor BamD (BamD/ComL family)
LASKSPAVEAPEPATTGVPAGVQAYEPPEVAPSRPQTRVSAPVDPTVQEHEILAEARRSLDTNPRDTLTRVADHERRFPSGDLSSDRELLRIRALMRLGRLSEARDARDRFLTRWPASAYRDEINQLVSP